ncbi:hypothetical protein NIES208_17660 (plasmid) [[Limnothrix rosea] IAM M-220]|nr:hypothetical protein NIES208_17660 [[Limnothrix rosea] IAM M-220]
MPFVSLSDKHLLPEKQGLYFVLSLLPESKLLYIGQTKNLSERWKDHHRLPEFRLLERVGESICVSWLESSDPLPALEKLESLLIEKLSPILNKTPVLEGNNPLRSSKINGCYELKPIKSGKKIHYYWYLRYRQDGKLRSKYLGKGSEGETVPSPKLRDKGNQLLDRTKSDI